MRYGGRSVDAFRGQRMGLGRFSVHRLDKLDDRGHGYHPALFPGPNEQPVSLTAEAVDGRPYGSLVHGYRPAESAPWAACLGVYPSNSSCLINPERLKPVMSV